MRRNGFFRKAVSLSLAFFMTFGLLWTMPVTAQAADVVLTVTFDSDGTGGTDMLVNDMLDDIALALSTSGLDEAYVTTIKLEGDATVISDYNWQYLLYLFRTTDEGAAWTSLSGLDLSDMTSLTTMRNTTNVFSSNITKLISLDLPTGLTIIGDYAFRGCTSLDLTSLPSTVTTIGDYAFLNCTSLDLTSLPSGVTTIGVGAFSGCTNLDLTSLPSNVTTIGEYAFRYCSSLALTSLPDSFTAIKDGMFFDCTSLDLTSLPSGVASIGISAFQGCTSLDLTSLPSGVTTIEANAFRDCTSLALTSLPSGVTTIGDNAFWGCTSLALTSLPSGVTTIESSAFFGCTSLALTSLPSGVTTIGNYAFSGCTSLALTSLPSGVTTIGNWAFAGCTSLADLVFSGMTAPTVGTNAFSGVTATVYYPAGATGYTDGRFDPFITQAYAPLVFTNQPAPQTLTAGQKASFAVTVTGDPTPTYQWQVNSGGIWTDISGETSDTLSFTAAYADNGKQYRCVAGNNAGSSIPPDVASNPATLTVNAASSGGGSGGAAPAQPSNSFTGGSVYVKGSGINLVHTTKKDFSDFVNARVDSRVISQGTQYKVESGSTVITLFADYLETLEIGTHKLEVHFRGGVIASAEFTVVAAETPVTGYQVLKPTRAAGTSVTAQVSNNTLILNGSETTFPAVNIDGYNYLKLRDIAALLSNTQKQFSLEYNADTKTIFLNSGMSYNPIGGELTGTLPPSPTAIATAQKLVVDGKTVSVSAYNIGGYNYFRLRDIAILLNFGVDFSGGAVWIDLAEGYSE